MRRILLLVGLPLLLIVIWRVNTSDPATSATVDIDTDKVAELRSAVISRLGGVGAAKVGEETSFDDGNSSLTFKVPTARLEEALAELEVVGGQVTHQRIDVDSTDAEAEDLGAELRNVQSCISRASGTVGRIDRGDRESLADCEARLRKASSSFASASNDLQWTELSVNLHAQDPITWWLTLSVALFVLALIAMGLTTWRSIRRDRMIDLSDEASAEQHDDLYLRRN